MELIKVQASAIAAIGYFDNKLYILFRGTGLYRYNNVSKNLFDQFKQAPSKGKFFNQHIRPFPLRYPDELLLNPAQLRLLTFQQIQELLDPTQ